MVKLWRELTRQGFPSNRQIKDAWKLSKSGTEKRLRGDRPGTSEDWKVWAEQLLPLPQPEPAREFLEAVIRGVTPDKLEALAARLQQKGPGESLEEESPNHSQGQDSSSPAPPPAVSYTDVLEAWRTNIQGIENCRNSEAITFGEQVGPTRIAYQRLLVCLQELPELDLNFVRLALERANDWREKAEDLPDRDELFRIDSEFRDRLDAYCRAAWAKKRVLQGAPPVKLKICRNQHDQLWLILTEDEFKARFPEAQPKEATAQELLSRWQHTLEVGLQDPQQARRFANLVADQREQIMHAIQALDTRILGLRGNQEKRRAAITRIRQGEGDPCNLEALRNEYKAMGVLLDQAKAERDGLQAMLREAGRFAEHVAQREYLKDLFGSGADPLAEAEMQADRLLSQAEKSELSMGQVKKLEEDLNRIFDPLRPPALDQAVTANQTARWKIEDLTQALQSDEYRTRSETDELLLEMERCQQILAETEPLRAHWERQERHLEPLRARLLVIQERARDRALRSAAPV